MRIHWMQWEPNSELHNQYDERAKSITGAYGISVLEFIKLWRLWNQKYPGKWRWMTRTTKLADDYQLRFWFDEPGLCTPDHADSGGYHLIVSICGTVSELDDLVEQIILPSSLEGFTKSEKNGVIVWRRIEND